jgi:lathosterol oxidase
MDIVLELTDTFIADYAYAYLYPFRPDLYEFPHGTSANASAQVLSSWTYTPATQYLQVQPSKAAYMSSLTRDNPYRQLATLFFITW